MESISRRGTTSVELHSAVSIMSVDTTLLRYLLCVHAYSDDHLHHDGKLQFLLSRRIKKSTSEMASPGPGGASEGDSSSHPAKAQIQSPNQSQNQSENETVTIQKIQALLKTKDDTSRFVGLALLKSVLDNSPQLREDEATITALWQSVSPKFLDRLLRSRSKKSSSSKDAKDMIDIAVSVLHIFSSLLPDHCKTDASLVSRIPALVPVVLQRHVFPS